MGLQLEILKDIDMILLIEKGIEGGISQCSKRYFKSNNEYLSTYDSDNDEKYLIYLDVNNLYGWAMSQYQPHGGFSLD